MKLQLQDLQQADAAPVTVEIQASGSTGPSAGGSATRAFRVELGEASAGRRSYQVEASPRPDGSLALRILGTQESQAHPLVVQTSQSEQAGASGQTLVRHVAHRSERFRFAVSDPAKAEKRKRSRGDASDQGALTSSMPGQVLKVLVSEGQEVKKGQTLVVIEAMKMEHEVKAPGPGRVRKLSCTAGAMVSPGVPLVELDPLSA